MTQPSIHRGRLRRGRTCAGSISCYGLGPEYEKALDRYEGWPALYRKETLPVRGITWMLNDITDMPAEVTEVPAMIYIMNQGHPALPSVGYLDTIERGFRTVGFHV